MKNVIYYGCWLILLLFTTEVFGVKQIALTFDDAPRPDSTLRTAQRTEDLLTALHDSGVDQVMFFITTKHLNRMTQPVLKQYATAGHLIANHSDQHLWLHKTDILDYQKDFMRAHELIQNRTNFHRFFRYPYLDEGREAGKSQAMVDFLQQQKYSNGYVTVDNYDWYLDSLYQDAVKSGQQLNLKLLKQLYVDVLWQAIEFSDDIAMKYLGYSPKHVLLLHDNDLAAMFIDDLVSHIKQQGWEVISPLDAYTDPIATREPLTLFKGQGRVAALARDAGAIPRELVHVAEDEAQLKQLFDDYGIVINSPE